MSRHRTALPSTRGDTRQYAVGTSSKFWARKRFSALSLARRNRSGESTFGGCVHPFHAQALPLLTPSRTCNYLFSTWATFVVMMIQDQMRPVVARAQGVHQKIGQHSATRPHEEAGLVGVDAVMVGAFRGRDVSLLRTGGYGIAGGPVEPFTSTLREIEREPEMRPRTHISS